MESSIVARYNKKCNEYTKKISACTNDDERGQEEGEYVKYQIDCMPYLQQAKGRNANKERTKVNLIQVFSKQNIESDEDIQLFHEYMENVEGVKLVNKPNRINVDRCPLCNETNILHDNVSRTCHTCGFVIDNSEISRKPSFKDKDRISIAPTTFTYKRENHFNEWLESLEASGKNDVPNNVLDEVRYELKKQRFTNPEKITAVIIRTILKKLRYNNYYDCIPRILSYVVGRPPLIIADELRLELKQMFRQVQKIYKQHAPAHRSNFFSYPYILYKFCELLEADHILPYLTLLKSQEKLYQQDQIFKSICKELQWEFIKTI